LISRETKRVIIDVADWLKTLIIETKVPVVAFGLPEALHVLDSTSENEQLARRFLVRERLTSFGIESDEAEHDFGAFLHRFDDPFTAATAPSSTAEPRREFDGIYLCTHQGESFAALSLDYQVDRQSKGSLAIPK